MPKVELSEGELQMLKWGRITLPIKKKIDELWLEMRKEQEKRKRERQ